MAAQRAKKGGASASPTDANNVVRIRPGVRVPKHNRDEDELAISFARLAKGSAEKLEALPDIEENQERRRVLWALAGIGCKLPRNHLRCIHSTLDEERDFNLRCIEVEIAKAEHRLEAVRLDHMGELENCPWWESPVRKPLVEANNERWEAYRARLLIMAETPARTLSQLERKRRMIGKFWLTTTGDWYDRLRAAVAADEAWIAENRPARKRRAS